MKPALFIIALINFVLCIGQLSKIKACNPLHSTKSRSSSELKSLMNEAVIAASKNWKYTEPYEVTAKRIDKPFIGAPTTLEEIWSF
jgi:hypothetical protein